MTSLGETYEKLMKFIRFFVNRAPVLLCRTTLLFLLCVHIYSFVQSLILVWQFCMSVCPSYTGIVP